MMPLRFPQRLTRRRAATGESTNAHRGRSSYLTMVLLVGTLVVILFILTLPTRAAPLFIATRSGLWEDPQTWGRAGLPIPDVNIPGPESTVTIPSGRTVIVSGEYVEVAALTVERGAVLQAAPGTPLHIRSTGDITNEGTLLAAAGSHLSPATGVTLHSITGYIYNGGRIRGGNAGAYGGPGGFVHLHADTGDVKNYGLIEGGTGATGFPDGWVWMHAASIVHHRGEARGGDVLIFARTADIAQGRVIAAETNHYHGDAVVSATQAVLAGSRETRVAGRGVFLLVGSDAVLDVQDVEDMAFLAQDRGLWVVGDTDARLYLTGNQARFAPFQAPGGTAHIWVDPGGRFLDNGVSLNDLFAAPLDVAAAQRLPLPRLLLESWRSAGPGRRASATVRLVNVGNATATFTPVVEDTLGWPVTLSPTVLPPLDPGENITITLSVDIPSTVEVGTTDPITVRVGGGAGLPQSVLAIPVSVRPRSARLPWLGHRAAVTATSPTWPVGPGTSPQVSLTWPGASRGEPVRGRSLLALVTSPPEDIVAADLAYWDGTQWVPIATTVDMENFVEDGVWTALWDTARVPLSNTLIRGRVWNRSGAMGQTMRQVTIEHVPVAEARVLFNGNQVTLDGTASSDLEGAIVSYEWDLGDGSTATGPTVTHTYGAGRYVVRLRVTDAAGLTDEAVYVLDTTTRSWSEQASCGCASATLVAAGSTPLPLPWEDASHQTLGADVSALPSGQMLRVNLALEASLTAGSNPKACRVEQTARGTWVLRSAQSSGEDVSRAWRWAGQTFPSQASERWGLVDYTRPSTLLEARDNVIHWVLGTGWGWREPERGLPANTFGEGARLEMVYRARVGGDAGACTCTWQVTITGTATGEPQVSITGGCP